ncbi:WSC-domain-containing protein [Parathielavia appendiculata]|uniref:WSC-domain-containing protein n=1 Tax=Parathielavia appendiculata TaxID=2587402 RepID=A0AAN6YZ71_9PEZI|nr:WSC-domain-containing protein [Parathielavia appendiculata]
MALARGHGLLAISVLTFIASVHSLPNSLGRRQAEVYTSKGCYVDNSDGHRALSAANYADNGMTVASCAAFCSRYKYFGLEFARECYCDNTISSAATIADNSECSFPCAGDATATCGAGDRLSVYENTAPASGPAPAELDGISYAGCFHEAPGRALPFRGTSAPDMTAAKCAEHCTGYAYFGTEYGSECYCGNEVPTVAAPESQCSMTCSGESSQLCGAGGRLNVYGPVPVASTPVEPVGNYVYQGCYTDSPQRVLSGSALHDDHMTLEMCAAACSSYAWFGVEYSKECYCGTDLSSSSVEKPQNDCNMPCGGNSGQMCGAANRLGVFHNPSLGGNPGGSPSQVGEFTYKSCWADSVYDRSLNGASYATDDMTLGSCAAFCTDFAFFGVEYSRECYCGNTVLGAAADEKDCSMLCAGDSSTYCGGPGRLNLYEKEPETGPDPPSDTCPGTPEASSAVLVNGAFECGFETEPWVISTAIGGGAGAQIEPSSGSSALEVFVDYLMFDREDGNIYIYQTLNTVPGQIYRLSVAVMKQKWATDSDGRGLEWSVDVNGEYFAYGGYEEGEFPWTTFTVTFTALGSDMVQIRISGDPRASVLFWFDNFVITKAVAPPPPQPA